MRYAEATNFEDAKPEMVKAEDNKNKKKEEPRVLAGSKDYDYASLGRSGTFMGANPYGN